MLGNYECPVISSTAINSVCQIGYNSGLIPGVNYQVKYRMNNFGNLLLKNFPKQ
jgi:hypothetical protein